MVEIKTLLPELRNLVGDLAEDLLARSTSDAKIDSGLREAFQQIEKGGRTAQAFEVWRDDYLDQVAVAWVLACVFVRFMEDNGLIDECWLAAEGERRKLAEDTHELFFRQHPHDTDREYFQHAFKEVGQIPAAKDLFAEGKTPLWAVAPSGDMAMNLLKFWREIDAESGHLKRSFQVESGDTRFLGDLYQELSEKAKKKYALLQTPVFVEEFILDRTLTPAIAEFGLEKVRMIDPTCGSGHFLLGGFARLLHLWNKRETNEIKAAQKALDGVWGVDINPFAVAIARFRLIVAAVQACGIKQLKKAPGWNIHLATSDSLLFGRRWHRTGQTAKEQGWLGTDEESWAPEIYACEDKQLIQEILGQQYHVVVGNPPYIIVRDRKLNAAYRERYSTCHGKYSLAAPFAERFFELALFSPDGRSGYVGTITANSFMKREFEKPLVEKFFPTIDLTHVLDTSGAFIPGHGTPTVLLFGRNRPPSTETVRAVLGIQGEPSNSSDPSQGQVWLSIVKNIDRANSADEFTSTADMPRSSFNSHPWSMGGGGATELREQIEESTEKRLSEFVTSIGFASFPGLDDAFVMDRSTLERKGIDSSIIKQFIYGETLRDWELDCDLCALAPYDAEFNLIPLDRSAPWAKYLWTVRTCLENVISFGGKTRKQCGDQWWGWYRWVPEKYRTACSLTFAFVASHNHFFLDRGGRVFNRSAPVAKLHKDATEDDHLALLGLLNSSAACFWIKQVSHQKQLTGGDGVRVQSRAKVPYEFAGTQILNCPVPNAAIEGELRGRLVKLTKAMEKCAEELSRLSPTSTIENALSVSGDDIVSNAETMKQRRAVVRSQMVFLQEMDFTSYRMFGLVTEDDLLCETTDWPTVTANVGMRPFEISQQRNVDGFEVPSQVPPSWPPQLRALWNRRIAAISKSKELSLIEDDHYKRRWIGRQGLFNHAAHQDELATACKQWLLDRLEGEGYWPKARSAEPALQSTAELSDKAGTDKQFLQVAALYRGRPDFDLTALIAELVEAESVPFLPVLRYKATGLRKRKLWDDTWNKQRLEDAGENVGEFDDPPTYVGGDFLKTDYWRLRGKLDVPKERWVSYPHCSTDSDPTLVVGWAGWNHLEQATALISYYDARKREGWDAKRLTPLLAGLDQLLPWIHQWHPEIDAEFGETAGQSFQTMLEHDAHELGMTLEDIRNWTPPERAKKTTKGRKKKVVAEDDA